MKAHWMKSKVFPRG